MPSWAVHVGGTRSCVCRGEHSMRVPPMTRHSILRSASRHLARMEPEITARAYLAPENSNSGLARQPAPALAELAKRPVERCRRSGVGRSQDRCGNRLLPFIGSASGRGRCRRSSGDRPACCRGRTKCGCRHWGCATGKYGTLPHRTRIGCRPIALAPC